MQQPIKAVPQKEPITAEKMAEINKNLKEELSQLIEKLETALDKFKDKKLKEKDRITAMGHYGMSSHYRTGDLMQKEKELSSA